MNTNKTKKNIYIQPTIEVVILDSEISLALQSTPPDGPGESANYYPEYLNKSPYVECGV